MVTRLWPTTHEAFKLAEQNPYVKCSCGWKYEVDLSKVNHRYDGVDCVNELLDRFSGHLQAVKNKWGKYDE